MSDQRDGKNRISLSRNGKTHRRVFAFVAVVVIILVVMIVVHIQDDSVVTSYIQSGTITDILKTNVTFIRKEKSVMTAYSGKVVAAVSEGERVSKGQTIAYIVSENMNELFEQLRSTERKLSAAQEASYAYSGTYPEEYIAADTEIKAYIRDISESITSGNISSYPEVKDEMDSLMRKKNASDSEYMSGEGYIEKLKSEIDSLNEQMKGHVFKVTADEAGIVSFYTDNTENGTSDTYNLITACCDNNSFASFDFSSAMSSKAMISYVGQNVTGGTYIARIMPEIYCYVIADTGNSAEKINVYKEDGKTNNRIRIYAEDGKTDTKGTVLFSENGKTVFRISSDLDTITEKSSEKLNIEIANVTGMKVPLSCLTEWDNPGVTARIAVVKSGIVRYVFVEVLAKNSEYAVISAHSVFESTAYDVKANDVYVVNYEQVKEGEVL